jgi:hypothetical protein
MHLHRPIRKKRPVAANQNCPTLAKHHPQAMKGSEVNDISKMLPNVHGAGSGDFVDAFTYQFL